jgi:elongation factor Ts
MQCRKALEEADGDKERALAILKKNSASIAEKKADRTAADGAVCAKGDEKKYVLVTLHCETDFVSRNEDFTSLLNKLTDLALSEGVEKMKEQSKELIPPVIQKTGEKIELGECFELSGGVLGSYIHNSKIGVLVSLEGGSSELAKDVAMQIAAMKPEYITNTEIPSDAKNMMKEVFEKEIATLDKPAEIKAKMLEGKISTYFKEKTLVEQAFIKDGDITMGKLLEKNKAKILEVKRSSI